MKRPIALAAAVSVVAALILVPTAGAGAETTVVNTSYAAAAQVNPGAGLNTTLTTTGSLGGLFDFLTPVLTQVVNPLNARIQSLPNVVVTDLVTELTGVHLNASSSDTGQSAPGSGYPDCSSGQWNSDTCYGPVGANAGLDSIMTVGTPSVQGYATADATGAYGAARTASVSANLLGVSFGSLGTVESSSKCLVSKDCSSTASVSGVSLIGGKVAARVDASGLTVSVNGSSYGPVGNYSTPVSVTGGGQQATVQAQNGQLLVTTPMSLAQLLSAFSLPPLTGLNATDAGSTINVDLLLGAGNPNGDKSTNSWGLEVGIGFQASIQINVAGLVNVSLVTGGPTPTSNLADLKLAFTSADDVDTASIGVHADNT